MIFIGIRGGFVRGSCKSLTKGTPDGFTGGMTSPHFISPDSSPLGVGGVGKIAEGTPDAFAARLGEGIRSPQTFL